MCAKCHDHPFEKWVQKTLRPVRVFSQTAPQAGGKREEVIV